MSNSSKDTKPSTNIENKNTQLNEEELKKVSGGTGRTTRTGLAIVHEGEHIVAPPDSRSRI